MLDSTATNSQLCPLTLFPSYRMRQNLSTLQSVSAFAISRPNHVLASPRICTVDQSTVQPYTDPPTKANDTMSSSTPTPPSPTIGCVLALVGDVMVPTPMPPTSAASSDMQALGQAIPTLLLQHRCQQAAMTKRSRRMSRLRYRRVCPRR
jgi:hypothetical protein